MSEWITDRLPTAEDGDISGLVWVSESQSDIPVVLALYTWVKLGEPWAHVNRPKPYEETTP